METLTIQDQQVEIYEPNQAVVTLPLPTTLSGGNVVPGFSLSIPKF